MPKSGDDWSNLVADAQASSARNRAVCGVALLLAELPEQARAALFLAMDNPHVSNPGLRKALMARGVEAPSVRVIQRHRAGECNCEAE